MTKKRRNIYGFKPGPMKPTKAEGSRGCGEFLKILMGHSQWIDTVTGRTLCS